jgi:hypothetical protein
MKFKQFGDELAQARLAKGISLLDISTETRINVKFLEAIESGQFQILPQTYVRAFLREYALLVGLNPDEVLQRYNSIQQEDRPHKPEETTKQTAALPAGKPAEDLKNRLFSLTPVQRNIVFGAFLVAIVVLMVILANMNTEVDTAKPVAEIPFDHVIRESEAAAIPPPSAPIDSEHIVKTLQKDSLRLEIVTVDSVWINLLIDGTRGEEYLFAPHRKRVWVAKERFVVTMGNAGGATFTLNGKALGSLGKQGAVVRNFILTEANIKN